MTQVTFMYPQLFWLLLVIPPLVAWQIWQRRRQAATLRMPSLSGFQGKSTFWTILHWALFAFRILAIALLITAMARPRKVDVSSKTKTTKGIDIVISMDISASMLARDLKPNRIESLKKVAAKFINERPNDRIGLVVYAGEAYTRTPVTSDKAVVLDALSKTTYDRTLSDGTAIGMGLATAVNRVKDSKAKSRIVILLTDGVNNTGFITPEDASDIAKEYGIKVYTIGLGTNGTAETPAAIDARGNFIFRMAQVEIDENLMRDIARKTGGKYFRATSNSRLEEIYQEINKLETSEIQELKFYDYDEQFRPFALAAFGLLLGEIIIRRTILRSFI